MASIIGFFLGIAALLLLVGHLYRRIYRPRDRNIYDAIPFLLEVDCEELEKLLDPVSEQYLRSNLGEKKFRKAQQKRMQLLLELARRMNHNAAILLELGHHDREKGWRSKEEEWQALGEELVKASLEFRGGGIAIKFALHRWLIRSVVFPFGRAPSIASLRKFDSFNIFHSYQRMVDAALDLGQAYGEEVHQKLVVAL